MNAITLTDLQAAFERLKEQTTIKDVDGKTLGVFTPWQPTDAEPYERATEFFDLEDLERKVDRLLQMLEQRGGGRGDPNVQPPPRRGGPEGGGDRAEPPRPPGTPVPPVGPRRPGGEGDGPKPPPRTDRDENTLR